MSKSVASKLNQQTAVSPTTLASAIRIATRKKRPVMIWGPPGIGKSDIVAQIALEEGRPLIDIRLPLMEPTDMRGIPYLAEVTKYNEKGEVIYNDLNVPLTEKVFTWSNPSDLPTDKNSRALVFFDEMSAAPPSVQAATYQLILNRKIGTYTLPKDVVVVAAGNRVKDKGVAYNMPTPLSNRFTHLTLEVNTEDWKEWAVNHRLHKDVVGYINFAPQELNTFEKKNADEMAFATPRTWSFVSDLLQDSMGDGSFTDTIADELILGEMIKGTVGEGPGAQFMAYRKRATNLPSAKDILSGAVTSIKSKEIDVMYALSTALTYELSDSWQKAVEGKKVGDSKPHDEVYKQCAFFLKFMFDNFEDEIVILSVKVLLSVFKLPIKLADVKGWKEFCARYGALISAVTVKG